VGAVVQALSAEFPDVTISKVRFLESEGLVTPARTASGYRQFTPADVERVRYVLRAQRDRFWPLKVIKANLDAIDRGLTPADGGDGHPRAPVPTPDPDVPDAGQLATRAELRLTAAELARATGLAPGEVADLVAHGLLRPDPRGMHDDADLQVASAAAGLRATCAASGPRPTVRWAWSSRSSARDAAPTRSGTPPRSRTCASPCTRRWCEGGCPAVGADLPSGARGTVTE